MHKIGIHYESPLLTGVYFLYTVETLFKIFVRHGLLCELVSCCLKFGRVFGDLNSSVKKLNNAVTFA